MVRHQIAAWAGRSLPAPAPKRRLVDRSGTSFGTIRLQLVDFWGTINSNVLLLANLVTTSKAPVTTSVALVITRNIHWLWEVRKVPFSQRLLPLALCSLLSLEPPQCAGRF